MFSINQLEYCDADFFRIQAFSNLVQAFIIYLTILLKEN